MEILKRRVKSKNKKEKFFGFIFYLSSFLCLATCQIGFTHLGNIVNNPENTTLFLMVLFFLLALMDATNDFADLEKLHKGSLDYFIAKINPIKSIIRSSRPFCIIPPIMIIYTAIVNGSIAPFVFFIYYLSFVMILAGVINMINSIPVPPEELTEIDLLEDITNDEKFLLKKGISDIVIEHGYVSRGHLEQKVAKIIELKKKRIEENKKKEIKEKYSKFIIPNSGYYGHLFYKNESGEKTYVKIKFPQSTPRQHIQKWVEQYKYCFALLNGNGDLKKLDNYEIDQKRGILVPEIDLYIPLVFEKENPLKIKVWDGYSIDYINEVGEKVNVSKSTE